MEVIYLDEDTKYCSEDPIVTAIGFFDGLHLGHMALVNKVKDIAHKKGYKKALMTFDHHPLFVLKKIEKEYYMTSMDDRIDLLEKEGIDILFVIRFSNNVAQLAPCDFIERYLIKRNICHIVCGFDFHFGYRNRGDCQTLIDYNQEILKVDVIDEVFYLNEKISSTRTRQAIKQGNMDLVYRLLNRYYKIKGKVVDGRKVGRKLGFPTANMEYDSYLLPHSGVYAVNVIYQNRKYLGMCNVGYNPTIGALEKMSVEVYIFHFHEEIYNKDIEIEFLKKIRDEIHFLSEEELIIQLNKDRENIKSHF